MARIYKPDNEYFELALNIYNGCTFGCKYCWGPSAVRKTKSKYHSAADPVWHFGSSTNGFRRHFKRKDQTGEVLISWIGDPYQQEERRLGYTREALSILVQKDSPFTILTKGGTAACCDFDILEKYPGARFGTSLSFWDNEKCKYWEPMAKSVSNRVLAIQEAKNRGIPTWLNLEPVIDPYEAIQVVKKLHPIVDRWVVGKVEHWPPVEQQVDWAAFHSEVTHLFDSIGADYYIKKSLRRIAAGDKNESCRKIRA